MTFEAAELILPQPYICRNASAKVCYILCKLHTYLNHPHSPSFLNPFEVLMLFSFIISCQCVKQCGGVGGGGGQGGECELQHLRQHQGRQLTSAHVQKSF